MQYKTSAEKEADNGEKFFKDFNNFINMKIKTLFANSTSKCKITKCFCKSTPLVLRNSISFLVSH